MKNFLFWYLHCSWVSKSVSMQPHSVELIDYLSITKDPIHAVIVIMPGFVTYVFSCMNMSEEKYTWVLSPKDRSGDVGAHYLVMKPIVEPGVKSVNTTVNVVSIAAQCKYWNETESSWSEDGCRVGKKDSSHPVTTVASPIHLFKGR